MNSLNPDFGQHLLVDEKILSKFIEECDINSKDKIIEIGAGTGIVTKALIKKNPKKVLAFEVDEKFKQDLENIKSKNLEVVFENAIKHSWEGYNKICASIPYYLSEQILLKAIENTEINEIILITGENFKKILEEKQEKVGIISDLYYNLKPILKIPKSAFLPPPRVNSWIIKLERKKDFDNQTDRIIANILNKKGKTKNAILYSLVEQGKTKNQAREIIEKIGLEKSTLDKPVKSITGKVLNILRDKLN